MAATGDSSPRSTAPAGPVDPQTVPEADVFRFDRVDRSGGSADDPPVRQGMTLLLDERGIASSGPKRRRRAVLPWSEVTRVSFGDSTPGVGGRTEVPIEVESRTGRFRYVVRSDHPLSVAMAALEMQVRRWGVPVETTPASAAPLALPLPPPQPVPSLPVPDDGPAELVDSSTDTATDLSDHPPEVSDTPAEPVDSSTDTATDLSDHPPEVSDTPAGDWSTDAPAPFVGGSVDLTDPSNAMSAPDLATLAPAPPDRPKRTRRTATLVVALSLLVSGIGVAVGLSLTSPSSTVTPPAHPTSSADHRLAEQLILTRADLPSGWRTAQGGGATANSPAVRRGEAGITRTLAHCMGISQSQASVVLGGRAADQTAQASSPIFVAPTPSASAGSALELQSAATVVRSHQDEQADFALLSNPRYPQCAATAAAADLQLGVDQTSRGSDQPGPATVSRVTLPGPGGVQTNGLLMAFSVKAGTASVSVQVESIWLGSHRVEANLQIFAIGGQIPSDTVVAPISAFQERVASGGKDSVV